MSGCFREYVPESDTGDCDERVAQCDACGAQRYAYHSCRNRHCPKCQTLAKERWLSARRAELLPVPYFHLVFTLPHTLNALAQGNPRLLYGMLFETVSATLIEFGANPRWLGGEIAATLILHTWGQTLTQHLHLHCLLAAGALHADGHWVRSRRGFLFPVQALSQVFRTFRALPWVVYAKKPFGGPQQVLDYLGRYTHRVAISNNRFAAIEEGRVSFRYKDYAHGNRRKTLTLEAGEFIRRFMLHVLPRGFMRIRHYGLLANRAKRLKLAQARSALDQPPAPPPPAQRDIHRCPHCHAGRMVLIASIHARLARAPPVPPRA